MITQMTCILLFESIFIIEYKQILHSVSGQFHTGEFIGILGPSGKAITVTNVQQITA
jgi:ABC-type lipopolysaccharide export system ATPase subunit